MQRADPSQRIYTNRQKSQIQQNCHNFKIINNDLTYMHNQNGILTLTPFNCLLGSDKEDVLNQKKYLTLPNFIGLLGSDEEDMQNKTNGRQQKVYTFTTQEIELIHAGA